MINQDITQQGLTTREELPDDICSLEKYLQRVTEGACVLLHIRPLRTSLYGNRMLLNGIWLLPLHSKLLTTLFLVKKGVTTNALGFVDTYAKTEIRLFNK